jgi:hypothetical protein
MVRVDRRGAGDELATTPRAVLTVTGAELTGGTMV